MPRDDGFSTANSLSNKNNVRKFEPRINRRAHNGMRNRSRVTEQDTSREPGNTPSMAHWMT